MKKRIIFTDRLRKTKTVFQLELTLRVWCCIVLFSVLGVLLGAALIVYTVDPLFRYRYPSIVQNVYLGRMQLPGILRNETHDLILIGSSMAQNFKLDDLREAFQVKAPMKCTKSALRSPEIADFLDIAAEQKENIDILLYGLDLFALGPQYKTERELKEVYCKKPFETNELRYFYSSSVWTDYIIKPLRWHLFRKKRFIEKAEPNTMFSWKASCWGAEQIRKELQNEEQRPPAPLSLEQVMPVLHRDIIASFRKFPQTRIIVFLPPYSLVYWSLLEAEGYLEETIRNRNEVLRELMKLPNVEIYDYNAKTEIITDLNLYKDITHYNAGINTEISRMIACGENRIHSEKDLQQTGETLIHLVEKYKDQYEKAGLRPVF